MEWTVEVVICSRGSYIIDLGQWQDPCKDGRYQIITTEDSRRLPAIISRLKRVLNGYLCIVEYRAL